MGSWGGNCDSSCNEEELDRKGAVCLENAQRLVDADQKQAEGLNGMMKHVNNNFKKVQEANAYQCSLLEDFRLK